MDFKARLLLCLSLFIAACGDDASSDDKAGAETQEKGAKDASAEEDESKVDAATKELSVVEACAASGTDLAEVVGNECAGVVSCGKEGLSCEHCCMEGAGSAFACGSDSKACGEGFSQNRCDGPEDCSDGEVCCTVPGEATHCSTVAACEGKWVCHNDEHCAGMPGMTCQPHRFFGWWGFCQPPASM